MYRTTQTFACRAKISFVISIVVSFFIVLDTWEDETVMWHSSERVYFCTGEWFSDFQFLTKTMKRGCCVFFEISLKTIRPSCILTVHLIYAKEHLSWVRPHVGTKISSKKISAGRRGGVDDWGKKGKESSPTPVPSTLRTCSQAKLLHPYSNNASLIADFSRIFATFFLCHC